MFVPGTDVKWNIAIRWGCFAFMAGEKLSRNIILEIFITLITVIGCLVILHNIVLFTWGKETTYMNFNLFICKYQIDIE